MIERVAREALQEVLGDQVQFDAALARFTSLGIGGKAGALAAPVSRNDLRRTLQACRVHRLPHAVLGAGFNTLAPDAPFPGVVIQLAKFRRLEERPEFTLRIEAGVSHGRITNFCTERGLSGLEFGAGIPGTFGGWLAMNAGIPGQEVRDVVREVEVMSPSGSRIAHLPRGRLRFVYRALRGLAPGSILLSGLVQVQKSDREHVKAEIEQLLGRRSATQPLSVPSCGSVFKNPPGDHAGRLIDAAGLKGRRIGGAQISNLHANFITNVDGASAADVLALIEMAQVAVRARTGVKLVREVRILGSEE